MSLADELRAVFAQLDAYYDLDVCTRAASHIEELERGANAPGLPTDLREFARVDNNAPRADKLTTAAARIEQLERRLLAVERAARALAAEGHRAGCSFFNYRYRNVDGREKQPQTCDCGHDALVAALTPAPVGSIDEPPICNMEDAATRIGHALGVDPRVLLRAVETAKTAPDGEQRLAALMMRAADARMEDEPAPASDDHLYECAACSAKPGSPTLCQRCGDARAAAGSARWRGQRPRTVVIDGVSATIMGAPPVLVWDGPPQTQTIDLAQVDLDTLDALHAKATAGPWKNYYSSISTEAGDDVIAMETRGAPWMEHNELVMSAANGDAIAALHNAYPALSAEIKEARATIARLTAERDEARARAESDSAYFDRFRAEVREALDAPMAMSLVGAANILRASLARAEEQRDQARAEVERMRSNAERCARKIKEIHTRWYEGQSNIEDVLGAIEVYAVNIIRLCTEPVATLTPKEPGR